MKKSRIIAVLFITVLLSVVLSMTALAGSWQRNGNGWVFLRSDGTYAKNIMLEIDGEWYGFDKYGNMMTNQWIMANGQWHYLTNSGAAARNQWIDGKYYVGNDCVMLTNAWTPDGYYVNELGEWDPSKTQQSQTGGAEEYYTIDGNWDNRNQSGYRSDYRVDAWIELNPADAYLATLNFGLYTTTGTTYSLYDQQNPNGDTINIATADGMNWGGRSTISNEWYDLVYDGKDTITLYWRRTSWTSSGTLVFKRRSGGRKFQYWSGGGVG